MDTRETYDSEALHDHEKSPTLGYLYLTVHGMNIFPFCPQAAKKDTLLGQ